MNVKPAARLQDPKIAEALAWPGALAEAARLGLRGVVRARTRVVLENVRFLAGYRRPGVVPAAEVERAWESVRDGEQLADAELRLAGGRPPARGAACADGAVVGREADDGPDPAVVG